MEIKDRVTQMMRSKGLTQADLRRITGLGSSQISYIIQGRTTDPRLSTAMKIADALDVSLDWLAGRDSQKTQEMDPFQEELNRCYEVCTPERKGRILDTARDAALASGEAAKRAVHEAEEEGLIA